jgi:WD40 repeat protein
MGIGTRHLLRVKAESMKKKRYVAVAMTDVGICLVLIFLLAFDAAAPNPLLAHLRQVEIGMTKADVEVRADLNGDPLPPGAIARIGSVRFYHSHMLLAVAFSGDGKEITSVSYDGQRTWDSASGRQLGVVKKIAKIPEPRFRHSVVSPDGKSKATVAKYVLQLRDTESGKVLWSATGDIRDIAYSPDSKRLAGGDGGGMVHVWDVATGREVIPIPEHCHEIRFMALSSDGKTVVTEGYSEAAPGKPNQAIADREVYLRYWDAATGKRVAPAPGRRKDFPPLVGLSPGGAMLLSKEKGDKVLLWSVTQGKVLQELRQDSSETRWRFSPSGKLLLSDSTELRFRRTSGKLRLWDVETGKELGTLEGHEGLVWRTAISEDNRVLVSLGLDDHTIRLWNLTTRHQVRKLPVPECQFLNCAFSRDGRLVAAAGNGDDHAFRVWEVVTGRELHLPDVKAIDDQQGRCDYGFEFGPDNRSLIASDVNGKICCWDLLTGKLRRQWQAGSRLYQLAFSRDGKIMASRGHSILIWDGAELMRKPGPVGLHAEKDLNRLWTDLAASDIHTAYLAIWEFADSPKQAIPFLRKRLRPAAPDDAPGVKQIAQLVADLDDESFAKREHATRRLEELGGRAEAELRRALRAKPSPEARLRAERLLEKIEIAPAEEPTPHTDELRVLRAVAALEYAGTHEAREVLETVATGAESAGLTKAARGALQRLTRRESEKPSKDG